MALAEYGNALNIDTDGSGRPILIDPDSGDTIAIYDRASGAWQVTTIKATTGDFGSVNAEQAEIGSQNFPALDDNGVVDQSGSSINVSLAQGYDFIKIRFKRLNTNTSGLGTREIQLQVDGITSDSYTTHRVSGSKTRGRWVIAQCHEFSAGRAIGDIYIFTGQDNYNFQGQLVSSVTDDPVIGGVLDSSDSPISPPISQLTLLCVSGVSVDMEIYGGDY